MEADCERSSSYVYLQRRLVVVRQLPLSLVWLAALQTQQVTDVEMEATEKTLSVTKWISWDKINNTC